MRGEKGQTMSTPTPTPWEVDWLDQEHNVCVRAGTVVVADCTNPTTQGSDIANARLIAAAPELLAALKEIEHRLDRWAKTGIARGPSGKDADWPTLLTQIHDAIAKADAE